jgi:molybdopterin/thiamine biosynthesis adenylyltransferase
MSSFDYSEAFSRNIGWVTPEEQQMLRHKKIAVGGLGGVGGNHLITLTRLGIGRFSIADLDDFEVPNFNRQYGASMSTLGKPKIEVMAATVSDINPEVEITSFEQGIGRHNLDAFLDGVDIYVDSLDMFALQVRRDVFAACYEKGIPAVTAAPVGMGTAVLVFLPGRMSFEDYFCLEGLEFEDQMTKFLVGITPSIQQKKYLIVRETLNFFRKKAPSTAMGIDMAAGVACSNVLKLLLNRGKVIHAPRGLHYDAFRNRLVKTWRPLGNRNPMQLFLYWLVKRLMAKHR